MSSFKELLEIGSSVSVYDRSPKDLAVEMCKIYHGISLSIMNEVFTLRHKNLRNNQYNLRNWSEQSFNLGS